MEYNSIQYNISLLISISKTVWDRG